MEGSAQQAKIDTETAQAQAEQQLDKNGVETLMVN